MTGTGVLLGASVGTGEGSSSAFCRLVTCSSLGKDFFADGTDGGADDWDGWEEGTLAGAVIEDVEEAETEGVREWRAAPCSSDFRAALARPT